MPADQTDEQLIAALLGKPCPAQRRALAKAITLLESTRTDHRERADALLNTILPHTGKSFRLGISGVPGVGKSTLIENLGRVSQAELLKSAIGQDTAPTVKIITA